MKTVAVTLRINDELVTWNIPNVLRITGGSVYLYEDLISMPIVASDLCKVSLTVRTPCYLIDVMERW